MYLNEKSMNKKIKQVGDDLVLEIDKFMLVIDKSILDLSEVGPGTRLRIKTKGKKVILEPVQEETKIAADDAADLQKRTERIVEKHKAMFKKLAE